MKFESERGARLIPAMMPARVIGIGHRAIVKGIGINEAVFGIEAVIALPGAAVAPVTGPPRRTGMPGMPDNPKVRCL